MNDKQIDHTLANAIVSMAPEPDDLYALVLARLRDEDKVVPMKPRADVRVGAEETVRSGQERVDEIFGDGLVRGRYEVIERLGVGSAGQVFRARDHRLLRDVALKVLHFSSFDELLRLEREAVGLAKLSHPNVVHVYDGNAVDQASHHYYIAMEFVSGVRLDEWQGTAPGATSGPPAAVRAVDEILEKYLQVARGLHAIHEQGLVHRDFKPSNVMLAADGSVRIVDFGLATAADPEIGGGDVGTAPGRKIDSSKDREVVSDSSLGESTTPDALGSGRFEGTVLYASPEQFLSRPVDPRADQFSFFVSLFEALFGRRPFPGTTFAAISQRVTEGTIDWPSARRPIPLWLHTMISRGLSPRAADRYPSFAPIIERLDAVTRPRRRRSWLPLTALLASSSVAAAAWLGHASTPDCDTPPTEIREAWSDTTRSKLHARLSEAAGPETAEWVAGSLDDYVRQWNTQHRAACIRSHGETLAMQAQEASPDDTRTCLSTQVGEFTAFTKLLSERLVESEHAVPEAREMWRLPLQDPALCSNPRIAASLIGDDASRNREVEELLRQSRVQHFLGNYELGLRVADNAYGEAADGKHPGLLVESLIQRALSRAALEQRDLARDDLIEAYKVARAARLQFLELEVMYELVFSESSRQKISAREELFAELLPAEVEALGLTGSEIEGRVFNALGQFESARGRYQDAFDRYDHAARVFAARTGDRGYRAAAADRNAANMLSRLKQHERALDLAQDAMQRAMQTVDERHPWMIEAFVDVGGIAALAKWYDLAIDNYRTAKELYHEQGGALARRGETEAAIELAGVVFENSETYDEAIAALNEAEDLLRNVIPDPVLEERYYGISIAVLYDSGEWRRLLDAARHQQALLERRSAVESKEFARAVRAEAKALAESGAYCDARERVEMYASKINKQEPGFVDRFRQKYSREFGVCKPSEQ